MENADADAMHDNDTTRGLTSSFLLFLLALPSLWSWFVSCRQSCHIARKIVTGCVVVGSDGSVGLGLWLWAHWLPVLLLDLTRRRRSVILVLCLVVFVVELKTSVQYRFDRHRITHIVINYSNNQATAWTDCDIISIPQLPFRDLESITTRTRVMIEFQDWIPSEVLNLEFVIVRVTHFFV
jgi:hypothetical protein